MRHYPALRRPSTRIPGRARRIGPRPATARRPRMPGRPHQFSVRARPNCQASSQRWGKARTIRRTSGRKPISESGGTDEGVSAVARTLGTGLRDDTNSGPPCPLQPRFPFPVKRSSARSPSALPPINLPSASADCRWCPAPLDPSPSGPTHRRNAFAARCSPRVRGPHSIVAIGVPWSTPATTSHSICPVVSLAIV
jgi:hypothetical protein